MARRGKFGKAALLMGAAAVAAGVLLKRDKVAGLLGQGQQAASEPSWTPAPARALGLQDFSARLRGRS